MNIGPKRESRPLRFCYRQKFMMTIDRASQALHKESQLILISEDFSGHRLDWFIKLIHLVGKRDLAVFAVDASRLNYDTVDFEIEICSDFKSKHDLIKFIGKNQVKATLIFWDGDNWLFEMFRLKAPIRALVMRPYLASKSLRDLAVFLIKHVTMLFLKKFKSIEFAYLAIPFCTVGKRRNYWVDDDLLIDLECLKVLRSRRSLNLGKQKFKILVPGYISERKNPKLVIDACKVLSNNSQAEFELMFQGKVEESLKVTFAANERSWLNVQDKYFPRSEYLELLNEADVVVIPYSNIASSGVAVECIALNVPLIMLQNYRWNGAASQEGINLRLTELNVDQLANILNEVLSSSLGQREEFDFRYTQAQTALNFLIEGQLKGST
jgi:glycosyltransferase involved in cell wall biosynthesis